MKAFRIHLLGLLVPIFITASQAQTNTFPASGSVGVGTLTPSAKLDINAGATTGILITTANAGPWGLLLRNASYAGGPFSMYQDDDGWTWLFGRYPDGARIALGPSGNLGLNAGGGNVGIGTTSPSQKLTVSGNISKTDSWIVGDSVWGANTFEVHSGSWDGSTNGSYGGVAAGHGYFYGGLQSGGYSGGEAGPGELYVSGTAVLMANVGIGTTSPTHKLSVNGAIRAKEVIVDTGWSDYVFADDYQLGSLGDLERQIKAEKHLPGIPSAKEVAEHGINVGDMQAKLLAKIEELTLHQIEQQKIIQAQSRRIDTVAAENQQLRARLDTFHQP